MTVGGTLSLDGPGCAALALPQTKMLLRSRAVQHWPDRRRHAVAQLMDRAVEPMVTIWTITSLVFDEDCC